MFNGSRILSSVPTLFLAVFCLALLGCGKDDKKEKSGDGGGGNSKVTKDNFAKLKDSMSEKDVIAILGEPSRKKDIPGGKELTWEGGSGSITIGYKGTEQAYKQSSFVEIK